MKRLFVSALALLMLFALAGCAFDNGTANMPSVSPDAEDGIVKDNDGYIGNEDVSDPAGDTVPENTMPNATKPEMTVPETASPDFMAPEQSAKPQN